MSQTPSVIRESFTVPCLDAAVIERDDGRMVFTPRQRAQ